MDLVMRSLLPVGTVIDGEAHSKAGTDAGALRWAWAGFSLPSDQSKKLPPLHISQT